MRDVVVDTRDVDVLRLVGRRCENESLIVIAIAGHIAIRHRQSLEVCHGGRVGSCLCRIDLLQLRKTEGDVSRRGSVHLTTLALHSESGSAWTLSRVGTAVRIESAQILKDAIAHRQTGNLLPGTYGFLRAPRPLVIHKKKQAVLLYGPADGRAKDIADQLGRRVAVTRLGERAILHLCQFVEVIVRACVGVAKVLVDRSVNTIGAAFGHQGNLGTACSSLVGVGIGSGYAKLLYGIERYG